MLNSETLSRDPINQYTLNISGGGASFIADEGIPENTMLALDLHSDDLPASMRAIAKVVRCKKIRGGYEVACEYWWVGWQNDSAQKEMADYIASVTRANN